MQIYNCHSAPKTGSAYTPADRDKNPYGQLISLWEKILLPSKAPRAWFVPVRPEFTRLYAGRRIYDRRGGCQNAFGKRSPSDLLNDNCASPLMSKVLL